MNAEQDEIIVAKRWNPLVGFLVTFLIGVVTVSIFAGICYLFYWLNTYHPTVLLGMGIALLCLMTGGIVRMFLD